MKGSTAAKSEQIVQGAGRGTASCGEPSVLGRPLVLYAV